jgi:lipopolysaccharide/colanic/teichoic acid biosynthesis glycosyltransferase
MVTVEWVNFRDGNEPSYAYLNGRLRRSLDILAALGLLILLAPVMCLIAVGIWLTSPGPILFRQRRYGRDMRPFELLKFRSMHCAGHDESTVQQATRGDPRVTSFGRILRLTSLDELPQLINVIMGDMSMVGPRPHAIEHDDYYAELIPDYRRRFRARPGLTGLAQVSGARGETPRLEDMQRRIEFDTRYLDSATLGLDCIIFLRTFREVFSSQTAY